MLRRALAVVLIVVGVVLTPVATVAAWARVALVDTDRFVAVLSPLATDPAVQGLLVDRSTTAIADRLDAETLLGDLFAGLDGLDLPPRARAALPLLRGAAAQSVETLIERTVTDLVTSDRFAGTWTVALRATHTAALAVLTRDPGDALGVSDDGELQLHVDAVVAAARQRLIDEGVVAAALLPAVPLTVTLGSAETLLTARAVYAAAVTVGAWMPWAVAVLLAAGVLLSRRRGRVLAWTAGAVAAVAALALVALAVARGVFADAAGDAGTAAASIYDAVVASLATTFGVLALVGAASAAATLLLRRMRADRNGLPVAVGHADVVAAEGPLTD
ncbi:hypothetical protein LJR045_002195 [Microbacterium sp. LjRoot45]|uniref:hypothetical protein n=1 Tax=Microbacterium sp. LjRoot45 TaxID=3342329 RepID=UPI003ECE716F